MAERQQDQEFDNHGDLILTGSANAYVAAPARAISGYFQGLRICGKANFTNSGASTLEIISPHSPVGLGAIAIRKGVTTALTGGEIISGKYYDFLYDATNNVFQLPNVAPNSSIANAQLADMAQLTIKARKTLSTGAPEDCTLSEVLDFITSAAQGDILYRGASAWARLAAGTSGQFLQTQGAAANPAWASSGLTVATPQATTSGTAFDFTGLPAGLKVIYVMLDQVSLSGTDNLLIQIGDSGGIETTSYVSASTAATTGVATTTSTSGFVVNLTSATSAATVCGVIELMRINGNTWVSRHSTGNPTGTAQTASGGGSKSTSAELDRVRLTRTGTNTFDAGQVNIAYA